MDYSSENSEENARQEHGKPIDDTVKKNDPLVDSHPTCSCGECSTAEETNAEIEEMEGVTKNLRNSNIELSDRVRSTISLNRLLRSGYLALVSWTISDSILFRSVGSLFVNAL